MKVQINSNWEKLLNSEFRKPYFTDLVDFVKNAYSKTVCYPPGKDIFRAFNECPLDDVKVVIKNFTITMVYNFFMKVF